MDSSLFFVGCGVIITIGSVVTALCTIFNAIKSPAKKFKDRQEQELKMLIVNTIKEILPNLLTEHDNEIKRQFKADRDKYFNEIKESTISDIQDELQQVKILGIQYESLMISARDVLREKIIKIYNDNKATKKLHIY